jgi:protoporphyrinogen oxidase
MNSQSKEKNKRAIILGGGLTGLAAADILADNFDVTVIERQDHLGGLAASFEQNGEYIPKYYHHIIWHNDTTQKYLSRFGLMKGCEWKKINVGIGVKCKITDITKPFQLMGFNYLSFLGRMRFGLFGLYTIFLMNPAKIPDSMDAQSWLEKRAGKEVTKKIFYNLYGRNKFNISLKEVSAKQFAYRLKEREVYDRFTFPKKGLQKLIDGLSDSIKKRGGKIITDADIKHIDSNTKTVLLKDAELKADIIISTIPIPHLLNITSGMPEKYVKQLSKIRWCPCVNVTFGTEQFLNENYYWTNFFDERVHVLMQHSALIDKYSTKVNWVLRYGGSEEDLELPDESIKKEYLGVVKRYFPEIKVKWARVFREKYAEPVYDKDYSSYRPDYSTPIPGFYLAGIQVTHPKIRNMNTALESGIHVANLVLKGKQNH